MLIFERFEGDIAVIENGEDRFEVKKECIDADVREGDVLKKSDGKYFADKEATIKHREKIKKLQNSLWS